MKDKEETPDAPKRRGRRPKPASMTRSETSTPETGGGSSDAGEEKSAARGRRGRPKRTTSAEPVPERRTEASERVTERADPIPETFSTSDDDVREPFPKPTEPRIEAAPAPERDAGAPPPQTEKIGPSSPPHQPPQRQGYQQPYQGNQGNRQWERPWRQDKFNRDRDFKKGKFGKQYPPPGGFAPKQYGKPQQRPPMGGQKPRWNGPPMVSEREAGSLQVGELPVWEALTHNDEIDRMAEEAVRGRSKPFDFNEHYIMALRELEAVAKEAEIEVPPVPLRRLLLRDLMRKARDKEQPIRIVGILELFDEANGILVYTVDNFRLRGQSCFVPQRLIERWGLKRGHEIEVWAHPPREGESCPFALKIVSVNGRPPEEVAHITPFTELVPYYPTERFLMETEPDVAWDNNSMRIVDLLTPVGLGQRGLIVAPPRTGKTVLMQGMANAIRQNRPDVHMIILLVDERPEEVTDFRRSVQGAEVISSTFDEPAESHVHAAEMVIEKARRMVEYGRHVVILLDSITRLARAYNTLMPSSGKILSGGVEASALQKPKRFFGSARNIEGGGSLTILGTALIETGSKMDEVIFEEFKGTGNMELDLDRALSDKRIFPAMSFEKSGTRKEELLYHKDELQKIYSLRRAMKGIPSTEAMEMLIQRVKKTKSNAEFLVSLNR